MTLNFITRNIFFTAMKMQFEGALKKTLPNNTAGKLLQLGYVLEPDKSIQKVVFENYTGDSSLTKEEVKKMGYLISVDIEKELQKGFKKIIILIDVPKKTIFVTKIDNNNNKHLMTI